MFFMPDHNYVYLLHVLLFFRSRGDRLCSKILLLNCYVFKLYVHLKRRLIFRCDEVEGTLR